MAKEFKLQNYCLDKELNVSGVYSIKNTINGKCYVGSGKSIRYRWYDHLRILNKGMHSKKLQNAVIKYGAENFKFCVLEFCNRDQLIEREQYWVDKLNSYLNGYNTRRKVTSNLGMPYPPFSEEHKRKLKEARKKQINPMTGRKHSAETIKKMSESAKGRVIPEWVREKAHESVRGKPSWNKGKKFSEETKRKMSEAQKKRQCRIWR